MIRTLSRTAAMLAALGLVAACVTVNIYFPAAEVSRAADEIVEDVYDSAEEEKAKPQGALSGVADMLAVLLLPATAHAQEATTVSNAAIRGLKERIAKNHKQLAPYYASGNVGIARDGSLDLRGTDGLSVAQVAGLKRLVAADNDLRADLYAEVARALNTDEVGKVRAVFADTWRAKAQSGWWVQGDDGSWSRK